MKEIEHFTIETAEEQYLRFEDERRWIRAERNRRLSVILGWLFYPIFIIGGLLAFGKFVEKTAINGICFSVLLAIGIYMAMSIGAKIRGE